MFKKNNKFNPFEKNFVIFFAICLLFNFSAQAEPQIEEAQTHLDKGIELRNKENYEEALTEMQQALILAPDSSVVLLHIAITNLRLNKVQDALLIVYKVIEKEPKYPPAYLALGQIYYEISEYDKSIEAYRHALNLKPNEIEYYFFMANNYNDIWANSMSWINGRHSVGVMDNKEYLSELSRVNKYLSKSIDVYSLAIKKFPKNSELYNKRGHVFSLLNKSSLALNDFNIAVSLSPDNIEYHYNRGRFLFKLKQYQSSILDFTKVIKSSTSKNEPKLIDEHFKMMSFYYRANSYKSMNSCALALQDFHQACSLGYSEACKEIC